METAEKELMKLCKYYKGEEENPFPYEEGSNFYPKNFKHNIWEAEKLFCTGVTVPIKIFIPLIIGKWANGGITNEELDKYASVYE